MTPVSAAILAAIVAGVGGAIQATVLGLLGRRVGVTAAAAIGAIAGAFLIVVAAAVAGRGLGGLAEGLRQPEWLWVVPGVFGAAIVISLTYAPPRIGTFGTFALVIAGQLAASLLIDGLGLFGVERVPVTVTRIAGLALLVAGGVLVLRR